MTSPYSLNPLVTQPAARHRPKILTRLRVALPKQLAAYLFLLPALIVFALFAWYADRQLHSDELSGCAVGRGGNVGRAAQL